MNIAFFLFEERAVQGVRGETTRSIIIIFTGNRKRRDGDMHGDSPSFQWWKEKEKTDEPNCFFRKRLSRGSRLFMWGIQRTYVAMSLGLFLNRVDALHAQHVLSQHHRNNNIYLANFPNQRITALGVASERRFDRIAVAWLISWLTCSHDLLRAWFFFFFWCKSNS